MWSTRPVGTPWEKNYDAVAGKDPGSWSTRFDIASSHFRGQGVGCRLLAAAEKATRLAGRRALDVETQHVNGAACRLYSANGFVLADVVPHAYPDAPHETLLPWSKQLV
ncbi:hypothetical protein BH11GEM1_BH11GEM1_28900 [soil metagenome]